MVGLEINKRRRKKMDELVNLIVTKTGLPKETARNVVNIVIKFLKDKLPDTFDALIDKVLMTGHDGKMDISDAANLLGGLFSATQKKKK
jgi:hypothetical protein